MNDDDTTQINGQDSGAPADPAAEEQTGQSQQPAADAVDAAPTGETTEPHGDATAAQGETAAAQTDTTDAAGDSAAHQPTQADQQQVSEEIRALVASRVPAQLHIAQALPVPPDGTKLWAVSVSADRIMAFRDTDGETRLIAHDADGNVFKATEAELAAGSVYPLD